MFKFLKLSLLVFYLIIWDISFAEETQILDEITSAPSSFESDYTDEPEITIIKDNESINDKNIGDIMTEEMIKKISQGQTLKGASGNL